MHIIQIFNLSIKTPKEIEKFLGESLEIPRENQNIIFARGSGCHEVDLLPLTSFPIREYPLPGSYIETLTDTMRTSTPGMKAA